MLSRNSHWRASGYPKNALLRVVKCCDRQVLNVYQVLNATVIIFPYDALCRQWFIWGLELKNAGSIVFSLPWNFAGLIYSVNSSPVPSANIWIWAVVSLPTVLTLDPLFCFVLITFPKEAFPKVSRALERRCQMKCFLLHMFISLVYILSGHSKAFLIFEMSVIKTFQLINAVLYSLAVDLVLLSRLV